MKHKSIRITGKPGLCLAGNVEFFDGETGVKLHNIRSVTYQATAGGLPTATVEFLMPEVDLTAAIETSKPVPFYKRPFRFLFKKSR